jgi:hypothetical protein
VGWFITNVLFVLYEIYFVIASYINENALLSLFGFIDSGIRHDAPVFVYTLCCLKIADKATHH